MEAKMIIGIPLKNFGKAYTRLKHVLTKDARSNLSKALLVNIVNSFKVTNSEIYLITKDSEAIEFAESLNILSYVSDTSGLNEEVQSFMEKFYQESTPWCIVHSDLPYINKFYAKQLFSDIKHYDFIASRSEDNGTPIIGGVKKLNKFHYGKNSFTLHQKEVAKSNSELSIIFSRELSFEIDTEDNYLSFKQQLPNWFKRK
jgi:2-phospho-L-lactate guanylyltransferase